MSDIVTGLLEKIAALERLCQDPEGHAVPFPGKLLLEVSGHCNLKCTYCAVNQNPHPQNMSLATYKAILDEVWQRQAPMRLVLNANGEPFVNPRLLEMLALPVPESTVVQIITNATLMRPELHPGLVGSSLNFLQFSIDSFRRAEYEAKRPPRRAGLDCYRAAFSNALKLIMANEEGGHPIYTSVCVMDDKDNPDMARQLAFWRPLTDNVFLEQANNFAGLVELPPSWGVPGGRRPPCAHLYDYLYICADGRVKACCLDARSHYLLGDSNRQSLEEIWNDRPLKDLRAANLAQERLRQFDLKGLDCPGCDSPYRGGSLADLAQGLKRQLQLTFLWKSFRARPTPANPRRLELCQAYLKQLDDRGEITEPVLD